MAEDLRYRLVYEESVRTLSDQQKNLDDLRSRAGILLSAASISTSFLGGIAIVRSGLGPWAWAAIASFVAAALLISLTLLPTSWRFEVDVAELLADYVESDSPADLDEMQRSLALYRQDTFDLNAGRLARLFLALRIGCLFLVVEVVSWLLDLALR